MEPIKVVPAQNYHDCEICTTMIEPEDLIGRIPGMVGWAHQACLEAVVGYDTTTEE